MKQKKCMKLKDADHRGFFWLSSSYRSFLTAIVLFWFANTKIRALGEEYGIKEPTYESLYNSSLAISKNMDLEFDKIRETVEEEPGLLEDNSYLNRVQEELTEKGLYIALRKDDRIYYNGLYDLYGRRTAAHASGLRGGSAGNREPVLYRDGRPGHGEADGFYLPGRQRRQYFP